MCRRPRYIKSFARTGVVMFCASMICTSCNERSGPLEPRVTENQLEWEWQNPLPTSHQLEGMHWLDAKRGIVVGWWGTIIKTTDGGRTWKNIESGTDNSLYAVTFTDENHGIIVGDDAIILRTTDAGETWSPSASPSFSPLRSVAFNDVGNVGLATDWHGYPLLRTIDGGESWQQVAGATPDRSVHFLDNDTAVGVDRTGIVFRTSDGGATWSSVPRLPARTSSLAFATAITGVIVVTAAASKLQHAMCPNALSISRCSA